MPSDEEIYGMPSGWICTNRQLRKRMSNVYLIYPSESTDDRLGAMKIYRDQNHLESMSARRELLALRTLESKLSFSDTYSESNLFILYNV